MTDRVYLGTGWMPGSQGELSPNGGHSPHGEQGPHSGRGPHSGFQKANLHTHTTISDGVMSPEEAIALYRQAGYSVLALTDHWKLSHTERREGMLLIGGVELDTPADEGSATTHIVALGLSDARGYKGLPPYDIIEKIHFEEGLAIVAHPHWSMMSEDALLNLRNADAFELYNGISYDTWRGDASALIDGMMARGASPRLLAGDDTHFYKRELFSCFTMIEAASPDEAEVMAALKAGRFYASRGPLFQRVALEGGVLKVDCSGAQYALFLSAEPWVAGRRVELVQGAAGASGAEAAQRMDLPQGAPAHAEYIPCEGEDAIRVVIVDGQGRAASTGVLDLR